MLWDGKIIHGNSPVGEKIADRLPDSLTWKIQLWTLDECVTFCSEVLPENKSNLTIKFVEPFMIQKLSTILNITYNLIPGNDTIMSSHPCPSSRVLTKAPARRSKPITTAIGRDVVDERAKQALGDSASGNITPHSFGHYFVTTILCGSGNLKLAQELARHTSLQVTQRYAHLSDDELDEGYYAIFEEDNQCQ